jgi:hypothetical protein
MDKTRSTNRPSDIQEKKPPSKIQSEKKKRIEKESISDSESDKENEIVIKRKKKISVEKKTGFEYPEEFSDTKPILILSKSDYHQFIPETKKFSEVQFITEPIYNAMMMCIRDVFKFHDDYEMANKNSEMKTHRSITNALRNSINTNQFTEKEEKETDEFTHLQNEESYKKIKGDRQDSELEEILSNNPEFSALSAKIDPLSGVFRDPHTGLYADLVRIDRNYFVLCFPGTGAGKMSAIQWKSNYDQIRSKNTIPPAFIQAVILAAALKELFASKNKKFDVAGHSLGGGIANYVGLKLNINSTCFNPAMLGQAVLNDLIVNDCLSNECINKQIILRIKKDPVSSKNSQLHFARLIQLPIKKSPFIPRPVGIVYIADRNDYPQNNRPPDLDIFVRHQLNAFQQYYDTSIRSNENN